MYPLTDNDKHGSMEPPSTSQHDQCACFAAFAGLAFLQYPTAILAMLVCRHLISYYYLPRLHKSTTRINKSESGKRHACKVVIKRLGSSSQFIFPVPRSSGRARPPPVSLHKFTAFLTTWGSQSGRPGLATCQLASLDQGTGLERGQRIRAGLVLVLV